MGGEPRSSYRILVVMPLQEQPFGSQMACEGKIKLHFEET
jgi:hypothetical protein